jgi:hypothetical protein
MAKHKDRRERRAQYHRTLDAAVEDEQHFRSRVIHSLEHNGLDIAQDGRPIRADFWRYIESRLAAAPQNALAAVSLVERAVHSVQPNKRLKNACKASSVVRL